MNEKTMATVLDVLADEIATRRLLHRLAEDECKDLREKVEAASGEREAARENLRALEERMRATADEIDEAIAAGNLDLFAPVFAAQIRDYCDHFTKEEKK